MGREGGEVGLKFAEVGEAMAPAGRGGSGMAGGGDGRDATEVDLRRLEAPVEERSICWLSRSWDCEGFC